MNVINVKLMTEEAIQYLNKNIEYVTEKVKCEETNKWIYEDFPEKLFIEKSIEIYDFQLKDNPDCYDKKIDFENSVILYEHLKSLPKYILSHQGFWLWLHFEKFYSVVKNMMQVKKPSTILDHWTHKGGPRRGLFFGVLSRCFYRVELTIDENASDKYWLTKWVVENPERIRNLTWRTYSSEKHLVRGIIKAEKRVFDSTGVESAEIYGHIAKYVLKIGSVKLLDVISEKDIEEEVYNEIIDKIYDRQIK